MLSFRKKSKLKKKKSLSLSGSMSGSVSGVDNRVIMMCEDIPSEETSWDSGQGSHSSGARSSTDELGREWRFRREEGYSMTSSPKPGKQCSISDVCQVQSSPLYRQNSTHSTISIRDLYESFPTVALCIYCVCSLSYMVL